MLSTPQIVALLIGAVLVTVVSRWVRLSYTIALLLLGLVLGAAPIAPVPTLNADVILFLFLPPLIFEAVFVMDPQHLLGRHRLRGLPRRGCPGRLWRIGHDCGGHDAGGPGPAQWLVGDRGVRAPARGPVGVPGVHRQRRAVPAGRTKRLRQ